MNEIRKRQTLEGEVISDKMKKTVVVRVTSRVKHPVYKKYVKNFKNFKAHTIGVNPKVGDIVKITSSRPLSKTKRWRVSEIIRESVIIGG